MAGDLLDEAFDEEDSIEYQNTRVKAMMVSTDLVDVVGDSRRRAPKNGGDAALPVEDEGAVSNEGMRRETDEIVSNGNHATGARQHPPSSARPSPPPSSNRASVVFMDGPAPPPSKLEGEQ